MFAIQTKPSSVNFQIASKSLTHYLNHLVAFLCKESDCERTIKSYLERWIHYRNDHYKLVPCKICKQKLTRKVNRTRHAIICQGKKIAGPLFSSIEHLSISIMQKGEMVNLEFVCLKQMF